MPAGKNALAGNKIRVSYKIKTRSRQFWDRLKGKFDNAFFLTRRKKDKKLKNGFLQLGLVLMTIM